MTPTEGTPMADKRITENDQFVAMLQRMIRALENRAIDDPAILAQVLMLAQRLAEIPNVVIATSAVRFANNPLAAPSMAEIGRLLGMTKQSASDRRKIGDRIIMERALDIDPIPQRERAARTRAAKHADETLAEWITRREQV